MTETATSTHEDRPAKVKLYLESRYRKLERGLPQTVFFCPECKGDRRRARTCGRCGGFGKLTKDSVQELVARAALPHFKARRAKFHGAGREDIDVLMLGRGRPFVLEVVDARRPDADVPKLDTMIREKLAGRVELEPFRRVGRERVPFWKESRFDKVYRLLVAVHGEVAADLVTGLARRAFPLRQRTPERVAHRRADLTRERSVLVLGVGDLVDGRVTIEIRCSHGTYVKEWVSGDGGRTVPSLSSILGVPCACETLDVLEILTEE